MTHPAPDTPTTAEINLSRGMVAIVDSDDFERLSQYKWCAVRHGQIGSWYPQTNIGKKPNCTTIKMHQLIMQAPLGFEIDHKNRNGLDNRKNNLRICSRSQNLANKEKRKGTSSKFKGVDFYNPKHYQAKKNWRARIRVEKKLKCIGYFTTEAEAAKAYNEAAIKAFGEFSCLNQI